MSSLRSDQIWLTLYKLEDLGFDLTEDQKFMLRQTQRGSIRMRGNANEYANIPQRQNYVDALIVQSRCVQSVAKECAILKLTLIVGISRRLRAWTAKAILMGLRAWDHSM